MKGPGDIAGQPPVWTADDEREAVKMPSAECPRYDSELCEAPCSECSYRAVVAGSV